MTKRPFVLVPAGPLGWGSYDQIMPRLKFVLEQVPAEIHPVWYPRPRIDEAWVELLKKKTSALVFPLGLGHQDSLWTLRELRKKWNLKIPAVLMIASDMTKGARLLFDYAEVFLDCDLFVVNSSPEKALLQMALGKRANCTVIPLPVDQKTFRPKSVSERKRIKSRYGLGPEDPLIVYSGRISYQKNVHELIEAFFRIKFHYPSAKLVIAGTYDDIGAPHLPERPRPRYLHALSSLITRRKLEDSILFVGNLEQRGLSELLGACDAQASLTTHSGEDFGYSIAQGMASGAPTLVSRWGGGCDFSRGGATGVPIRVTDRGPEVDSKDTADLLRKLLLPAQNLKARKQAINYADRYLSDSHVLRLWKQALGSISQDGKASGGSPLPLKIPHSAFLTHYNRFYKQGKKQRSDRNGAVFSSTKDPLFRKICRIYSGSKPK